jgi:hypothetical protein
MVYFTTRIKKSLLLAGPVDSGTIYPGKFIPQPPGMNAYPTVKGIFGKKLL